jgi:uncharacterized protein (TIGR03083 family)
MSSLAERTVSALRANHDHLTSLVSELPEGALIAGSGAAEWTVAQVLSHLGSGAEIATGVVSAARAGEPVPGQDVNQEIWDRWNALGPEEQAAGFIERSAALVAVVEALAGPELETTEVELGFMPAPLPLPSYLGMRLNEVTLHGWDVEVAVDPKAELAAEAAATLAEHFADGLGFLLRFTAQPAELREPAVVEIADTPHELIINREEVRLTDNGPTPTASFTGPLPTVFRLLAGRLKPDRTPADVEVRGNVTLDDLRTVFPGY